MIYCEIMKKERKKLHKNQTDIANILNIKREVYARYERGENELPIRHLIKLADFYGVTTDYLLGRTTEPHQDQTPESFEEEETDAD